MFEDLMNNVIAERNKLIDKCTKNLIKIAGFELAENISDFELIMLQNDMKVKGYKIELRQGYNNKDRLYLLKMEDLHEEIIAGYEIDLRIDENSVSIVTIPIGC